MILLIISITILIAIAFFQLTLYFLTREKHRLENSYYSKKGRYINRLIKDSWYNTVDGYMKEAGYYISTEVFIIFNLIIIGTALYTIIEKLMTGDLYGIITNLIRLFLFTVVPLNILIYRKISQRRNKIRLQLCNIQDIMYFQSKIGTPEDVILAYTARVAKHPLQEPLQYIANAPKVRKSFEEDLENLRSLSKITELQAFSFALAQRYEMGISEKSFKAQSNILKRSKRLRKKIIRQHKRTKLVMAACLLFACYVLLVSVPLVKEVLDSLNLIFR
ncbi:hypothetical protein F8154_05755 [Alkaliphilus pronyensis]|uniref:Type II secretion system protein GspF domain-containing protein n=1 Tax=Alkaliphilus pronyensis TaxID=1482732 RepID=A0A6I0FCF9_9FIRM|nr:hypothetical protein [Alkaliphilus pronyensis]KAB3535635.1 hypothetical protein F8154_05755 [Alkaliphilus pronyensis]